jgi:hypothetical protein
VESASHTNDKRKGWEGEGEKRDSGGRRKRRLGESRRK